jgi:hypothetical protein
MAFTTATGPHQACSGPSPSAPAGWAVLVSAEVPEAHGSGACPAQALHTGPGIPPPWLLSVDHSVPPQTVLPDLLPGLTQLSLRKVLPRQIVPFVCPWVSSHRLSS